MSEGCGKFFRRSEMGRFGVSGCFDRGRGQWLDGAFAGALAGFFVTARWIA